MRFGICINGDPSLIAKTKEYGYDYVEIALFNFAELSNEKISKHLNNFSVRSF